MNKYYKILPLLCLASLFLSACKKEAKEAPLAPVFPIDFYLEKLEPKSGLRLFTKDGEIKDPLQIAKFAAQKNYFELNYTITGKEEKMFSFASKDQVIFQYSANYKGEFDVEHVGERFLFSSNGFVQIPYYRNGITNNLFKYELIDNTQMNPFLKFVYLAYGDYKTLVMPIQLYYASRTDYWGYRRERDMAYNEINESFVSTLKEKDTLAFKTYQLSVKAR